MMYLAADLMEGLLIFTLFETLKFLGHDVDSVITWRFVFYAACF